jgi:2,4-dienoyl-CoA reductase-like NADH-dependent reductase (Old Yellow Enzyme family)/thioredoxin reductase
MSIKYQNLLSPLKIGNLVFKNRMTASASKPHYIQGPETFPTEALITHYARKAKNGAALVTCSGASPVPVIPNKSHDTRFDLFDGHCLHYLSQLTEAIHFYGSKASMCILSSASPQYDVSTGIPWEPPYGYGNVATLGQEIPAEMLEKTADDFAVQAAILQEQGFDMVYLHMAYRAQLLGRFLSPLINKRTDEYGGSLENRARFPLMVADRIKQKCGRDLLIEACISGCEPSGGYTLEDAIKYARMFTDHFDLLQLRASEGDLNLPTGFNLDPNPLLYMAEAIKKSGAGIAVVTIGGFQNLDVCEDVIASGKADLIAMARNWISNPDYGKLAYEGRDEDVVPCLRCNKCSKSSYADPWASVCSVNPVWGLEHKIERMVEPPVRKKKVAVVGGGPAGMEAALVASGRGHQVTLYEQSRTLGGLLKTADNVSFKWPLRDFKNYLVRRIEKSNIRVCLNARAKAETLKKENYDAVLAAVGSEPIVPGIPGVSGENVVFAKDVYGNENALARDVVVIGGGEVGVETGMHLAEKGHQVTLLEMGASLAPDATPVHYYTVFRDAWEKLENFKYVLKARCTGIASDQVTYLDAEGVEHYIKTGSVVIAVGMKSKIDLALEFSNSGDSFFMIGDCNVAGNVQKVMRSAFSIASLL